MKKRNEWVRKVLKRKKKENDRGLIFIFYSLPLATVHLHCRKRAYADCKDTDSGQSADRYRLQCKAKRLDNAG